jgi:hypothetical protein
MGLMYEWSHKNINNINEWSDQYNIAFVHKYLLLANLF